MSTARRPISRTAFSHRRYERHLSHLASEVRITPSPAGNAAGRLVANIEPHQSTLLGHFEA
jgi:hypothetical protein